MALVHVHHVRLSVGWQNGAEGAQAANAQNDLLTNARVLVAAVEVAGDPAIVLTVLGQIRIQQVQRHATHSGDPHAGVYGAARKRHVDHNWRALRVEHRAHRHGVRIETIVGLALVARVVDHLAEVAVPIHQPDGDERQTKVAGGLEVVAGQHAEAARVDRQRLGNREFGAEVGDARDVLHLRRAVEVLLQITVTLEDALGVLGQPVRLIRGRPERGDRVVGAGPRLRRERLEQLASARIPRPAQVVGQLLQAADEIVPAFAYARCTFGDHSRISQFGSV